MGNEESKIKSILLVTGEASGDMHGANLVRALDKKAPHISIVAMGGEALRNTKAEVIYDHQKIAVMGLVEVIKHYPEIRRALKSLKQYLHQEKPSLLVLIDYAEFNLKLAETANKLGIPVLFYISPKFWAWREKRVYRIARLVDMMAVIFPFEVEFYEKHNVPVRYVGNPLTDKVMPTRNKDECLKSFNPEHKQPVISILPGSRQSEITRLLPIFIDASKQIKTQHPDALFLLPLAPGMKSDTLTTLGIRTPGWIKLIDQGQTYDVLSISDAAMIASGTATLEAALMKVPMAVAGKLSALSYAILSRMVKINDLSLANIVAEKTIVKEFIQSEATANNLSCEINNILDNAPYRENMLNEYGQISERLGELDGSENTADLILEMLHYYG